MDSPTEETSYSKRQSLNISHFNAVQTAVSNLARIDDFDLEELGYGFFSDVFKVTHKLSGKVMVLKRNKKTNTKMNILREVQLMNRLSHPNILKFKGVCVHEGQLHALTEFLNGGDLDQLVQKKDVILSWCNRIDIAADVSKGMEYLHSVGVFHRDLSAKNCLIRIKTSKCGLHTNYQGVVGDLGLAEKIPTCEQEQNNLTIVGTPYIIAPEVLHWKPYNQTADVFSYGIVLCQLLCRLSCDPEELPRTHDFGLEVDLFKAILESMVSNGDPAIDKKMPPEDLLDLTINCCQVEASIRPSFQSIVERLKGIRDIVTYDNNNKRDEISAVSLMHEPKSQDSLRRSPLISTGKKSVDKSSPSESRQKESSSSRRSAARLSRSFSKTAWELLDHAANMANQQHHEQIKQSRNGRSHADSSDHDQSPSYTNPFAAYEVLC